MPNQKLDLIQRRNSLMVKLLWGLFILNTLKFVFDETPSPIPAAFGFAVLVLLWALSLRRQLAVYTMYLIVVGVFSFFFVLLTVSPYPVNFLFLWLGLIIVVLYQSYVTVLLAASLAIGLSTYFYLTSYRLMYPMISDNDLVYVVMFGVFLTVLLVAFIRFTTSLEQEAEHSREQLRRVLDSAEVAIWSLDLGSEKVSVSIGIEKITGYPAEGFSENTKLWEEVISDEDRPKVLQAKEILEAGQPQTVEYRLVHADGAVRWVQNRVIPVCSSSGQPLRLEGVLIDITERKEMEQQIRHLAYHDPLTGLPNRTLFEQLSTNALLRAKRQGQRLAVMFIDLDDFKETNDLFGHEFGDRALKSVAERLAKGDRKSVV